MKKPTVISLMLLLVFSCVCGAYAESDTRIVTDVWNREVEIPQTVETILCLGSMAPRFAAYLDVVDMMIGGEDADIKAMSVR